MSVLTRLLVISASLLLATGCAPLERDHKLYVRCVHADGTGDGVLSTIDAPTSEPYAPFPDEDILLSVDKFDAAQKTVTVSVSGEGLPPETFELKPDHCRNFSANGKEIMVAYHWD